MSEDVGRQWDEAMRDAPFTFNDETGYFDPYPVAQEVLIERLLMHPLLRSMGFDEAGRVSVVSFYPYQAVAKADG